MAFVLTSPAFADNGAIPKRYTCEDADVSPPLNWSQALARHKEFRTHRRGPGCIGSASTKDDVGALGDREHSG